MGLHPDFPLFPHKNGRWCKKVRGQFFYFGKIAGDPKGEAALKKWVDDKDDLIAGRTPRGNRDGLAVGELCDRFLQSKEKLVAVGKLSQRMLADYKAITDRIVSAFGKRRLVTDLRSHDFAELLLGVAKTGGVHHQANVVQRVRTIFKWAYDEELIDSPIRFGSHFKKPSKREMRLSR